MLKMFLIYSAFFGSPVLHACYLFFTGQVLKGSLHPKEQPMHYQMETLLGGLPSMEVRDQKDYIMQMKFSLIKPLNIVPSTFQNCPTVNYVHLIPGEAVYFPRSQGESRENKTSIFTRVL